MAGIVEDFRRDISSTPITAGGSRISFTVSVGLCGSASEDIEAMIRRADELLYQAKEQGRDRLVACLDEMCEGESRV